MHLGLCGNAESYRSPLIAYIDRTVCTNIQTSDAEETVSSGLAATVGNARLLIPGCPVYTANHRITIGYHAYCGYSALQQERGMPSPYAVSYCRQQWRARSGSLAIRV